MAEINRTISFDTGIEQILAYADTSPAKLPDGGQYVPGEGFYQQQLNDVLLPPSVEQSLLESFRPQIKDRSVLTPTGYQAAHNQCQQDVQEAIEKLGDQPDAQKLKSLVPLLQTGTGLTRLLNTYRHLLHRA